jgi:phenylacetate-CoA ligase
MIVKMVINWRKPIAFAALRAFRRPIIDELKVIRALEFASWDKVQKIHNDRLISLLRHAWEQTDYYRHILTDAGVVRKGEVYLENFAELPFLTKDIIRREGTRLKAKMLPKGRQAYQNKSGGSTGQPVEFFQDSYYWNMNIASKLYRFEIFGKKLGEPEMKIWGSERDLFEGTIGLRERFQNFLYNRAFEQCFHLPEHRIRNIVENINRDRPKILWAYRDGMDVIADYVNSRGSRVHRPAASFCAGGTLYPHIVEAIERAFQAPVINFYGSREMGDIACQCKEKGGLHIAAYAQKVEVIDEVDRPIMEKNGELVITSLHNYAMPFIRYRIGDHGKLAVATCPCGRGFPLLESVSGRTIEMLINANGDPVDPMYFIHLIGVVYNPGYLKRFQIIQEDYARIVVKIILEPGVKHDVAKPALEQIVEKIRLVMGNQCVVLFEFVDSIPLTASGKHQYVIRKFPVKQPSRHLSGRPERTYTK